MGQVGVPGIDSSGEEVEGPALESGVRIDVLGEQPRRGGALFAHADYGDAAKDLITRALALWNSN
ncbi:hypothetical protein [Streptomyces sp. NPDC000851]